MKKVLALILAIVLTISLVGCEQNNTSSEDSPMSNITDMSSDSSDTQIKESVCNDQFSSNTASRLSLSEDEETYFKNLLMAYEHAINIRDYSVWEKAEEISPDRLVSFYYKNEFFNYFEKQRETYGEVVEQTPIMRVPASEVERYIQKYFYVDINHLRKTTKFDYNLASNTYGFKIEGGFGGGYGVNIQLIVKRGDILDIYCQGGADMLEKDKMIVTIEYKGAEKYKFISAKKQ